VGRADSPRWRGIVGLLLLLASVAALAAPSGAAAANGEVRVVRIAGTIDAGIAPYLARALRDAEEEGATAVILEINTPGGRLDAALQMRQALLDSPVRTIAFVDREAFSAGALIAIAAKEIYMADGAVIGAATPVTGAGETASPKVMSAVRATFKATAEARGRNGAIAEAMVDPAVAIEGLVGAGELLTLTDDQARERGYSLATVADRREVLRLAGLADAPVRVVGESPAESAVRVVTNPALAGLLFMVGIGLIVVELLTSSFTGLGLAGAGLLGLFFWGHLLAGLAGWEGIALVALGLALLAAEVFLIPGFGVAGAGGIAALLGGLFLSVTGQEIFTRADLERGLLAVGMASLVLLAGGLALLWSLPRLAQARGLTLQATVGELIPAARGGRPESRRGDDDFGALTLEARVARDTRDALLGARGEVVADLRPAGYALIDGRRVDVISRGEFIARGEWVEIVADEGYRRIARRLDPDERAPATL
jgi:membrane-bound serine protease (ClpP class)